MSPSQRDEVYDQVTEELHYLYEHTRSITTQLKEFLDDYVNKIPFVNITSLEELAEDLKEAAETGAMIGGVLSLYPILAPYMDYASTDEPVVGIVVAIGICVVGVVSVFTPLVASVLAAAYAVALAGMSFRDVQEKYFAEFKKA
jgi:phage-related minor tail protein